jgi:hypothetical protein
MQLLRLFIDGYLPKVWPYQFCRHRTEAGVARVHCPTNLALAIEANRDVALPAAIRDYLLRTLRGKVKARRGRKSLGAVREIRDLLLLPLYDRYLGWLRRRRKRFGLKGWAPINNAEWWQGSPSERAARMVAQHLRVVFPNHGWEHVRNEISALRRRRKRCS